jgi:ketosteroid isomerase-like protein
MPQENVEVVRDALDALGRGGLDAMADYWTDDVEHRAIEGAIDDRGPMHGKAAVRAYVQTGSTISTTSGLRWSSSSTQGKTPSSPFVRISGLAERN